MWNKKRNEKIYSSRWETKQTCSKYRDNGLDGKIQMDQKVTL